MKNPALFYQMNIKVVMVNKIQNYIKGSISNGELMTSPFSKNQLKRIGAIVLAAFLGYAAFCITRKLYAAWKPYLFPANEKPPVDIKELFPKIHKVQASPKVSKKKATAKKSPSCPKQKNKSRDRSQTGAQETYTQVRIPTNSVFDNDLLGSIGPDSLKTAESRQVYYRFLRQTSNPKIKLFGNLFTSYPFSEQEVRAQAKRLLIAVHPDHYPGDAIAEEVAKEINKAKDQLLKPVDHASGFQVIKEVNRLCWLSRWPQAKERLKSAQDEAFLDVPALRLVLGIVEMFLGNIQTGMECIEKYANEDSAHQLAFSIEHFKNPYRLAERINDPGITIDEIEECIERFRDVYKSLNKVLPWAEQEVERLIPCSLFIKLKEMYKAAEIQTSNIKVNYEINLREAIRHCRTTGEKQQREDLIQELKLIISNTEDLAPLEILHHYFNRMVKNYQKSSWYSGVESEISSLQKNKDDLETWIKLRKKLADNTLTSWYTEMRERLGWPTTDRLMYKLLYLSEAYIMIMDLDRGEEVSQQSWIGGEMKLADYDEYIPIAAMAMYGQRYTWAIGNMCGKNNSGPLDAHDMRYIMALINSYDTLIDNDIRGKGPHLKQPHRMYHLSSCLCPIQRFAIQSRYSKRRFQRY